MYVVAGACCKSFLLIIEEKSDKGYAAFSRVPVGNHLNVQRPRSPKSVIAVTENSLSKTITVSNLSVIGKLLEIIFCV